MLITEGMRYFLLAVRFREHLMDIHNETAKPVTLNFNTQDHLNEDISVPALKSWSSDKSHSPSYEKHLIYSLSVLNPVGINIQNTFSDTMDHFSHTHPHPSVYPFFHKYQHYYVYLFYIIIV